MERRDFIRGGIVVAASTGVLACNNTQVAVTNESSSDSQIIHSVYFWLKEGLTEAEQSDFTNFFEMLRKVPSVQTLKYGKPAPSHPRPVVDNSFSYNLIVTFSDIEGLNAYEIDPGHLAGIEKYQHYWTKVEVRDTQL